MTHTRSILASLGIAVLCSTAGGQTPMNPTLLKRIAEAVDGDTNRGPVFVVARSDALNPVVGVLRDRNAATTMARQAGPAYAVYGPYLHDPIRSGLRAECFHDGLSAMTPPMGRVRPSIDELVRATTAPGYCIDTLRPGRPPMNVSILYDYGGGVTRTIPVYPGVDAIFLSVSAIDKFVVPYYTRLLGVEAAAAMRRGMLDTARRR